jgi:hypothetical protein
VLHKYLSLYTQAIHQLRDVCYLVAMSTRCIGEEAIALADLPYLSEVVKMMNTYIRFAVNARDVRTLYNVLLHYRLLAESVLASGNASVRREILEIASHLRYYCKVAFDTGLVFISDTVANDLGDVCLRALEADSEHHDELLHEMITLHE